MDFKLKLKEGNIYFLGNTLILSFVCMYLFGSYIIIDTVTVYHMIIILFVSVALVGFYFFQAKGKIFWMLSLFALIQMAVFVIGGKEVVAFIRSYFLWMFSSDGFQEKYILGYEIINVAGITILIFLFEILCKKCFNIKIVSAVLILIYMIYSMFVKTEICHMGVALGVTYLLLVYIEWVQSGGNKTRCKSEKIPVLWLVPFIVIYFALMSATPAPKEPFDWKFAKDIYSNIKDAIIVLVENITNNNQEDFDVAFTGFSESGGMFGGLSENDKEVMLVTSESNWKTNIYMIGKVFDEFNGKEWIQMDNCNEKDREEDSLETLYAIRRHDISSESDYIYETKLNVEYKKFNTGYLFAPLKSWKISGNLKDEFINQGESLVFNRNKGYGTGYDIKYLQMNLDHPGFYKMIEEEQGYKYGNQTEEGIKNRQLLYDIQLHYTINSKKDGYITEEDFSQRAKHIIEVYGNPVNLSEDVQKFVNEITKNAVTDVEKLKAIESALSQMTYTTSPGKIPEGKDFLEYFLLETREGYCSYFATAFVLLARSEGIPARYVQGFCVPSQKQQKTISVLSKMAHAWPEVYFEGIGWIPFEPTPSYSSIRYTPWEMRPANQGNYNEIHYTSKPIDLYTPEPLEETETEKIDSKILLILLYTVIFAIIVFICFLIFDIYYGKRKYNKMSLEEKIYVNVLKNMNILYLMGYSLQKGETLSEFRERTIEELVISIVPLNFIVKYEEIKYSDKKADISLINEIRDEKEVLLSILKKQKGKMYLLWKIRLYFMKSKNI